MDPADAEDDLAPTIAFFAERASGWETRFPDDEAAFDAAIHALSPLPGGVVLDAGCGSGRALGLLRRAVGTRGLVIGLDVTSEMLAEATRRKRRDEAALVLGDARRLPFATRTLDAILAAGLIGHLPEPHGALTELARATRTGGRLALFHPIGRAKLAKRHGRSPDPNDVRAGPAMRGVLSASGWQADTIDDGPDRYLVLATRV